MKQPRANMHGLTLIELLVALVICAMGVAGIYRLFIAQSRAYVVQDQVAEVQQNIRTAMEMIVRDVRMAGFDYDNSTSLVRIEDYKPRPPYLITGNSITVWFEHYRQGSPPVSEVHAVRYVLNGTKLERQLTVNGNPQPSEVLLENVTAFQLLCGRDGRIGAEETQDGVVNDWVDCGTVNNNQDKIIAVRVTLTTRPEQTNPQDDRFREISPRSLTSTVALRNLSLRKL
ncbi:MAG: PilW family protein [Desulfobacterota bacterium]|nr:PilW family protein [Thermodesulfobacteriota bacterium]